MKLKLVIFVVCLFSIQSFSQKEIISFGSDNPVHLLDSISAVAEVDFRINDRLSDWSDNFSDIIYSIGIYKDKKIIQGGISFSGFMGGYTITNNIPDYELFTDISLTADVHEGTNPGDYTIETLARIATPGTYYFVGTIKGLSEHKRYFEEAGYWVVNCLPKAQNRLMTNLILKDKYYYGEKIAFDFSVSGIDMNLQSAYHYKVFQEGELIYSGSGSFVNLDYITNNPELVNKRFSVVGYYSGKLIHFFNPQIPGPDSTIWEFQLLPPAELKTETRWMTSDEFGMLGEYDLIDALDMHKINNRIFSFTYLTAFNNTGLVTLPELKNIEIYSEPSEFLMSSSENYLIRKINLERQIELKINPVFINSIAEDETRRIDLFIKFETQFGEKKEFHFIGFVF
ncbi:MAG: hypothetical protein Kow0098_22500 [Ignavibacteriaceae bacterium]